MVVIAPEIETSPLKHGSLRCDETSASVESEVRVEIPQYRHSMDNRPDHLQVYHSACITMDSSVYLPAGRSRVTLLA